MKKILLSIFCLFFCINNVQAAQTTYDVETATKRQIFAAEVANDTEQYSLISTLDTNKLDSTDIDTLTELNAILTDANLLDDGDVDTLISNLQADDLVTLSGVALGSTNLGVFSGSTITDNSTNKTAIQELETAVESINDHTSVTIGTGNGLSLSTQILSLALATNSANGAMSSTWIQFLESIDTEAEFKTLYNLESGTDFYSTSSVDTLISNLQADDLVTLSGVTIGSTNLSTFTGTTITDNVTVKVALQDLETEVETKQDELTSSDDLDVNSVTTSEIVVTGVDGEQVLILNNNTSAYTPSAGESGLTVTNNTLQYFNNGGSLLDVGSGALPSCSENQILVYNASSVAVCTNFEDHPQFVSLLEAFNGLGFNSFVFVINTPTAFPYYVQSTTASFSDIDITDTSTTYDPDTLQWQDDDGGYATNDCTYVTDHWECSITGLTEGANDIQLQVCDDKPTTPNCQESIDYSVVSDQTDPVLVAGSDDTHDGTGTVTGTVALTETNYQAPTYIVSGGATDSGTCTGTYPNYSTPAIDVTGVTTTVTMTFAATDLSARTASGTDLIQLFTYSSSSYLFEWSADDTLTAETFNVTDGGTISPQSDATPSYSYVTGVTNNAIQFDSGTWARFAASQGNNIDYSAGSIEFDYRYDAGTPSSATYILAATYASPGEFYIRRSTGSDTDLVIAWAGATLTPTVTENIFDGSFHNITMTFNCSTQDFDLIIDTSTYNLSLSTTDVPDPPTTQYLYLNGLNNSLSQQQVTFDNFKIQ